MGGGCAENGTYIESDEVPQRHGVCGDPEQGHVEMFLCDAADLPDGPEDSIVNQSCFNKYPLDRAGDDEGNSPVDPANRGRFILDPVCRAGETDQEMLPGAFPGDVATARFQLPQGVTCERCVIQMVYYAGNSCKHQGYAEFNPESWPSTCAPTKDQWINEEVGFCGEGDNYPEEFWNCADISIASDEQLLVVHRRWPGSGTHTRTRVGRRRQTLPGAHARRGGG